MGFDSCLGHHISLPPSFASIQKSPQILGTFGGLDFVVIRPSLLYPAELFGIFVGIWALSTWAIPTLPLKDVSVRNAKSGVRPRKLSDGGGLHVLIQSTGSKRLA